MKKKRQQPYLREYCASCHILVAPHEPNVRDGKNVWHEECVKTPKRKGKSGG